MLALTLGIPALVSSCGIDAITGTSEPFEISIGSDSVFRVGDSWSLEAVTADQSQADGARVRWTTSNPSVVAVDSLTGSAVAVGAGTATLGARVEASDLPPGGVSASLAVRVDYSGIAVTPPDSLTGLGMSVEPVVRGLDINQLPTGAPLVATLSAADPAVVLTSGPRLIARGNGTTTVTATVGSLSTQFTVRVRQVAASVSFGASPFVFTSLGRDTSVAVTVRDTRDSVIVSPALTWTSLSPTAVSVGTGGSVRALTASAGSVQLSVDTVQATLATSVQQQPAQFAIVAGGSQSAVVGSALASSIVVRVLDAGGYPVATAVGVAVESGGGSVPATSVQAAATGDATLPAWTLGTVAGTQTLRVTAGNATTLLTATALPGPVTSVSLDSNFTTVTAATPLPAVRISLRDEYGNVATTSSDSVTLGLSSGTLSGTLTRAAVAGVATFDDLTIASPSSGTAFTVSVDSIANRQVGQTFVVIGPAAQVAFSREPYYVEAGQSFQEPFQVSVRDAAGNLVGGNVAVTVRLGANPGADSLRGTLTQNTVAGVATFGNLELRRAASGYRVIASAAGLASDTSASFAVFPGAAVRLGWETQPIDVAINGTLTPSPRVALYDAFDNQLSSGSATISVALGSNPGSATLGGTVTRSLFAGLATFSDLTLNAAGTGYTLVATASGLQSATSNSFNVTQPGSPVALVFVAEPTDGVAGTALSPALTVHVVDSVGVRVTASSASVTLALVANDSGATAFGTLTRSASSGIATFTNVRVNRAGAGYRLVATATGLGADTTAAFGIVPGPRSAVTWVSHPSSATAGVAFAQPVVVALTDAYGNVVSGASDSVHVTVYSGPSIAIGGTTRVQAVNGRATFDNLALTVAGSYQLQAFVPGSGSPGYSGSLSVLPSFPAALEFTSVPTRTRSATPMPAVSLRVVDSYGNTVTDAANPVSLATVDNPQAAALAGTLTQVPSGGTATFYDASVSTAAPSLRLVGTASGLTPDTSDAILVYGPAASLHVIEAPTSGIRNTLLSPLVVEARDALGSVDYSFASEVTVAVAAHASGAGLTGTVARSNASEGRLTFADLRVTEAGSGIVLRASSGSLTAAETAPLDVSAFGVATALRFVSQPPSIDVDSIMVPAVVIEVVDAALNRVTTATPTVSVALANNGAGATLSGTTSRAASAGLVSFDNLTVSTAGTGFSVVATATGFANVSSSTFNVVNPGQPIAFSFVAQPNSTTAGSTLVPAIQVCAVNSSGAVATAYAGSVTLAVHEGPAGATLTGTATATASSGCASFVVLSLQRAGVYRLRATGGGLTQGISQQFTISPGVTAYLAVISAQSSTVAGEPLVTPVVVEARDRYNNRVQVSGTTVRLCLSRAHAANACSPSFSEGALTGDTVATMTDGVATLSNLRARYVGYTGFRAEMGGLSTYSTTFGLNGGRDITISPSAHHQLAVENRSSWPRTSGFAAHTVQARNTFNFSVQVQDSLGNAAPGWTAPITLDLSTNPTGATLSGVIASTISSPTSSSLNFYEASVGEVGSGYRLRARSQGLVEAISEEFDATYGAAAALRFVSVPSTGTSGSPLTPDVLVAIEDGFGNRVLNAAGTISIALASSPGGTLSGTVSAPLANGLATFSNLVITGAGSGYTLRATTGVSGVPAQVSGSITIGPP